MNVIFRRANFLKSQQLLFKCLNETLGSNLGRKRLLSFSSIPTNQELSYFNGPSSVPLLSHTVGNVVDKAASVFGTKEAIVVCASNTRKNFVELKQDVDKFAAGLLGLGINRGDRIGIWYSNDYEWILTQFAAAKAGLILVSINPTCEPNELMYCLQKTGVRVLVTASKYKNHYTHAILESILPSLSNPRGFFSRLKNLTHVIMVSNEPMFERDFEGVSNFADVANMATPSDLDRLEELQHIIQFDDPVCIQFTSGTTGISKGATLSHFNVVNNSYLLGNRLRYHENKHRICMNLPLHQCFGSVGGSLAGLLFGVCQVYPSPSFDAYKTVKAICQEHCTSIYGTPPMYSSLLQLPDLTKYDLSTVNTGVIVGSYCNFNTLEAISEKLNFPKLCMCYGSSETSPIITQSFLDDDVEKRLSTVGKVLDYTEIKIVDTKTGLIVPCGTVGELCTRGYLVMMGYWDDPVATKEIITPNRWCKTGDLAVADKSGYVKIIARLRDLISRENTYIYPNEIEDLLCTHPKVAEAHVVGIPGAKKMGEEICAWVRLKREEKMNIDDLKKFCEDKLAKFKIPRYIKFVESFPTTVTGSVKTFLLKNTSYEEFKTRK